mmetsp:Transcript_87485/g.245650  ORF Transcript_87485/g.245650 Transcript_87485/m.245650 type:complete len:80 (-) Transcript_87485:153-392(-)
MEGTSLARYIGMRKYLVKLRAHQRTFEEMRESGGRNNEVQSDTKIAMSGTTKPEATTEGPGDRRAVIKEDVLANGAQVA